MSNKFSFRNLIDSASKFISKDKAPEKRLSSRQKSQQQEIENAILVLAAAVVRCDRNYSADEEKYVHEFLSRQFGASGLNQRYKLMGQLIETGTEPFVKMACKELKLLIPHESRLHILRFLFGLANAGDFVNAKETRCIHRIAGYMDITDKEFKELRRLFLSQYSPYQVLETDEEASFRQVKAAYRKMILKYHPDKRAAGLSEEEAASKFRQIQRAFDTIKSQQKEKQI